MDHKEFETENNVNEENVNAGREETGGRDAAPREGEAFREEAHVKNGGPGGFCPRGPEGRPCHRGPWENGPRPGPGGPGGRPCPRAPWENGPRPGPGGPRGPEGRPCPMGPREGFPFPGGRMPGCVPPPRFHRRPAMRPGFEPEAERKERYDSLSTKDRITFQLKALGHILRMLPGTRDGQNRVLEILLEKGTLSQRELMELADIRSASLSELVVKLEINGYVRRYPNPMDHRSMSVTLTEAGCLAARALRDDRTDLYEGMSQEELERLLEILEKLGARWQRMLPGAAARKAPFDDTYRT